MRASPALQLTRQPWWEWIPGMLAAGGFVRGLRGRKLHGSFRVNHVDGRGPIAELSGRRRIRGPIRPDLNDPGTVGGLLELLDRASTEIVELRRERDAWTASVVDHTYSLAGEGEGPTKGEAIAAALLSIEEF